MRTRRGTAHGAAVFPVLTQRVTIAGSDFDRWAGVHALLVSAFAFMEGRIDPPSSLTRMGPETLAEKAATETLLFVEQDGCLIGCAFCDPRPPILYLGKIAVAAEARGQGLARAMVDRAAEVARSQGLTVLELQTRIELTENHATFARLGFAETGRTCHPGFDRPTSVTMRRPVT